LHALHDEVKEKRDVIRWLDTAENSSAAVNTSERGDGETKRER